MSRCYCVYGGQYGSEGKGSFSEYLINNYASPHSSVMKVVIGENSPNSGHTCSRGKTRNIPAASYFADQIMLGPDSVIDVGVLIKDMENVRKYGKKQLIIHERAAVTLDSDSAAEGLLVKTISSTGSGSGWARVRKYFHRNPSAVVEAQASWIKDQIPDCEIACNERWFEYINQHQDIWGVLVFECSQGVMLDPNIGLYPWVTSRSTIPQVAIARNGLFRLPWEYCGVFRTFPIRTGGPSGPTYGAEIDFDSLGVAPEIATVTGRTRRIFEFNQHEFEYVLRHTDPEIVAFTHLDYIGYSDQCPSDYESFIAKSPFQTRWDGIPSHCFSERELYVSHKCGQFTMVKSRAL